MPKKGQSMYQELNNYDFLWQKYWKEELTMSQIAEIIGCNSVTVGDALKRLGIRIRTKSECSTGKNNSMYGKHHSKGTKQKISNGVGKGEKNHFFGKPFTEEHKQKISEANKNPSEEKRKRMSEEKRKRMSEANRGEKNGMYGKHPSEKAKQKMSDIAKEHWQNPDYIKKVIDGWNRKPNTIEKTMNTILQKYLPGEFRYNENFDCGITIGGKIPDFVDINGRKIIIEVFGPWHDKQFMKQCFDSEVCYKRTEIGTKAIYLQFGFKCIVFWEKDLEREDVEQFVLSELKRNNILGKIEEYKQRKEFIVEETEIKR